MQIKVKFAAVGKNKKAVTKMFSHPVEEWTDLQFLAKAIRGVADSTQGNPDSWEEWPDGEQIEVISVTGDNTELKAFAQFMCTHVWHKDQDSDWMF